MEQLLSKRVIKLQQVDSIEKCLKPQIKQLLNKTAQFNSLFAEVMNIPSLQEPQHEQHQIPQAKEPQRSCFKEYKFKKTDNNTFLDKNEMSPIWEIYGSSTDDIAENCLLPSKPNFNEDFDIDFCYFPKEDSVMDEDIYYSHEKMEVNEVKEKEEENGGDSSVFDEVKDLLVQYSFKLDRLARKMHKYKIQSNYLFKPQGTYSIYDQDYKDNFCLLCKYFGKEKVAEYFNLSLKSLKRWIDKGTIRKAGGGRKTLDAEMEEKVNQWFREQLSFGIIPTGKMIKAKARSLSKHVNFKASKGWYSKFKKKYQIQAADSKKAKPNLQIESI